MSILLRNNCIQMFLTSLLIMTLFLSALPMVMGEDPIILSQHNLDVQLGTIHQLEIIIGEPVIMFQELTVRNTQNVTVNASIILSEYSDLIPAVYLEEYLSLSITSEGKLYSAQPILPVRLAPYQSKEYILEYEFVPVYKNITCTETSIKDFLPSDAVILPSSLPPETIIEKNCNVKIHHDGEIHYYNVEVTLEELEGEKINSIYYVEGDTNLKLVDGVISLAK